MPEIKYTYRTGEGSGAVFLTYKDEAVGYADVLSIYEQEEGKPLDGEMVIAELNLEYIMEAHGIGPDDRIPQLDVIVYRADKTLKALILGLDIRTQHDGQLLAPDGTVYWTCEEHKIMTV